MRALIIILASAIISLVVATGLRGHKFAQAPAEIFPDMDRQAKVKAQTESQFFADGRSSRVPVRDTVPIGYERPMAATSKPPVAGGGFTQGDDYLNTGKFDSTNWGTGLPIPLDLALLTRGQERFGIYCALCHGATGAGDGITAKYGMVGMANFHQTRLLEMADGEIYSAITNGKNTMLPYGDKLTVRDRWAIVAYIRALQRTRTGTLTDVPESELKKLGAP